jgi:hypothetical protein
LLGTSISDPVGFTPQAMQQQLYPAACMPAAASLQANAARPPASQLAVLRNN